MRGSGEQGARRTPVPDPAKEEALEGLVELITFHSEETGFCVLKVKARGFREKGRKRHLDPSITARHPGQTMIVRP